MKRLLALIEKHLGVGYVEIADFLREQNTLDAIESRLISGDYAGAITKIDDAAKKLAADIHESYVTAGRTEAKWLDARVQASDKLIRFDEVNDRAVYRAKANQYELVEGFTLEQREKTRAVLTEGLNTGTNPRVMARDLRDGLGLTPAQQQHVTNYRRALESGDWSRAGGYELRDGRADRTLRMLQRDGGSMTPAQIDKLVERYRTNYINHRAEVIARTEGLRAANEGSADLFRQAIERGDIEADQLVKEWHAGPRTKNARAQHSKMDGKTVGLAEDFVLPDGTLMAHPGDPRGGAKHTAQCRCAASTTFAA